MKPRRSVLLLCLSAALLISCGAEDSSSSPVVSSSQEETSSYASSESGTGSSSEKSSSSSPTSSSGAATSSAPSSEYSGSDLAPVEEHCIVLSGTNGQTTGAYNTTEDSFFADNDNAEPVGFAYMQLMRNTANASGFAQFKSGSSYLYNTASLGTIDAVTASYDRGTLSVSFANDLTGTWTDPIELSGNISPDEGYSYLKFTAPDGAVMVDTITIDYHLGGSDQPHSSSSQSSGASSSSSSTSSSGSREDILWDMDLSSFGSTFQVTLAKKIKATRAKTASYDACLSIGAKAAAYPTADSKTFIPFYHDAKDSEKTTIGACNREHTWPNSRGSKKTGMGADPIMVRPTLSSENNSRSNYFYDDSGAKNVWDPACCGYEGARGESARVILYCATAYYDQGFSLSNNPGDSTNLKTMGTLKTLLEWNREYPPTDFERLVTERYYQMGYARNPFVDHPEYADYIYDDDGLRSSAPVFPA